MGVWNQNLPPDPQPDGAVWGGVDTYKGAKGDTGATGAAGAGAAGATGAYYDSNNLPGTAGQVLSSSVTGTAWTTLTKSSVGLNNVDNTSDVNKPISTATQTALNTKQDTLVSGTNIKTVNGSSVIGSGNINAYPNIVLGVLGSGYSGYYSSCSSNQNTGTYIDLPVGNWKITLQVLVTANLASGEAIWGRMNLGTLPAGVSLMAGSPTTAGLQKSGNVYHNVGFGFFFVSNTSGATQRIYVYIGGCDYSVDRNWSNLMGSSWGENGIWAERIA